ncbi:MAG: DUF4417 domain-containing protein [Clostridia bacterium]|nr:DUF4417 domain-containing protein [Clostridia bacterium]
MNERAYRKREYWENQNVATFPGEGPYGIPRMLPCTQLEVERWIGFNFALSCPPERRRFTGVHFWVDDAQFKRVWTYPRRYRDLLLQFGAVTSPEFSVFETFPVALRLYNQYRNAWLARFWAEAGINVVPSVVWTEGWDREALWETYPVGSILALSTVGCMRTDADRAWMERGIAEMQRRLRPVQVLLHGKRPEGLTGPVSEIPPVTEMIRQRVSGSSRLFEGNRTGTGGTGQS